jgi:hypothetical protein
MQLLCWQNSVSWNGRRKVFYMKCNFQFSVRRWLQPLSSLVDVWREVRLELSWGRLCTYRSPSLPANYETWEERGGKYWNVIAQISIILIWVKWLGRWAVSPAIAVTGVKKVDACQQPREREAKHMPLKEFLSGLSLDFVTSNLLLVIALSRSPN